VDIAYVKRSSEFLPTCEQAINESRTVLLAGESISIKFDTEKRGYKAKITVEIREGDENSFGTNWNKSDPTRFPRRVVAAAAALHKSQCYGQYLVMHQNGHLEIQRLLNNAAN